MKRTDRELPTPLDELKRRISAIDEALVAEFWSAADVSSLVQRRAVFIDAFLSELWELWFRKAENHALLAVGGYGRGELHPHSDVDLLILVRTDTYKNEAVESFVRLLWDLGLEIGISVRTPRECLETARTDLTIMTALLERRLVCGSGKLAQDLDRRLNKRGLWPAKRFFQGKVKEQSARHAQFVDVEYGLEPNIKTSPGGLRDIQTINWVTNRIFGSDDPQELTELGLLTQQEADTLAEGKRLLWKIRFALHVVAGRKEDQLLFSYQREIATRFGYQDEEGLIAVEQFMRDYYRVVLELREVNDILLQTIREKFRERLTRGRVRAINDRFQLRSNYLEVRSPTVFKDHPPALMEMFVHLANNQHALGVRANTIRLVRDHLYLIGDEFRKTPEVSEHFLTLLRSPHRLVSQLTRLRRYGILGRYIPEFGRVIGQMQHDLFHIYTVDAHTMILVRNLRRFFLPNFQDDFSLMKDVVNRIDQVELLYLAALFHDLGKGLGGNHSSLGAESARVFCKQLGLSSDTSELVVWLVQNHLLMSTTSQRLDISDPDVIQTFAEQVKSTRYLNFLLLLTVADIKATAPKLWNTWRSSLLQQLYLSAHAVLERGINVRSDVLRTIEEKKRATAIKLQERDTTNVHLEALWSDTTDSFVLNHDVEMLADIAIALEQKSSPQDIVVLMAQSTVDTAVHNLYDLFVCAPNRKRLFADCVSALSHLNLQVMNARITTGRSDVCYDSFAVMTLDGRELNNTELAHTKKTISDSLSGKRSVSRTQSKHISRQMKQFSIPTKVNLKPSTLQGLTELELIAADRPGLLALVGHLLDEMDVEIHSARISTLGERVEDFFTISRRGTSPKLTEKQKQRICDELPQRISMDLVEPVIASSF